MRHEYRAGGYFELEHRHVKALADLPSVLHQHEILDDMDATQEHAVTAVNLAHQPSRNAAIRRCRLPVHFDQRIRQAMACRFELLQPADTLCELRATPVELAALRVARCNVGADLRILRKACSNSLEVTSVDRRHIGLEMAADGEVAQQVLIFRNSDSLFQLPALHWL